MGGSHVFSGRLRTGLAGISVLAATAGLSGLPFLGGRGTPDATPPASSPTGRDYAELPISFVPNEGQLAEGFGYGAQGIGYSLGLGPAEAVFGLSRYASASPSDGVSRDALAGTGWRDRAPGEHAVVRMQLIGADPTARSTADLPLPGRANYLIGDDPGRWRRGIPTYGRVTYQGVYPGVDVSYHGNQGQLEYDFLVTPEADPSVVDLGFAGVEGLRLDDHGDLVLTVAGGELRQHAPVIYQ